MREPLIVAAVIALVAVGIGWLVWRLAPQVSAEDLEDLQ